MANPIILYTVSWVWDDSVEQVISFRYYRAEPQWVRDSKLITKHWHLVCDTKRHLIQSVSALSCGNHVFFVNFFLDAKDRQNSVLLLISGLSHRPLQMSDPLRYATHPSVIHHHHWSFNNKGPSKQRNLKYKIFYCKFSTEQFLFPSKAPLNQVQQRHQEGSGIWTIWNFGLFLDCLEQILHPLTTKDISFSLSMKGHIQSWLCTTLKYLMQKLYTSVFRPQT